MAPVFSEALCSNVAFSMVLAGAKSFYNRHLVDYPELTFEVRFLSPARSSTYAVWFSLHEHEPYLNGQISDPERGPLDLRAPLFWGPFFGPSMARQRPAGCAPLLLLTLSLFFDPAPAGASSLLRAAGEVCGSKSVGYQKQESGWEAMQRRMGLGNGLSGGGRLVCHPRTEFGGALLTRGALLPKPFPNPSQTLPKPFPNQGTLGPS